MYKLNTYLVLYFSHLHDIKKNFIKTFQWKIYTYLVFICCVYMERSWKLEVGRIWILNSSKGKIERGLSQRTMSHVTACIVPEASSNPLKLPRFPRDTNIEFVDAGRKGPTINVVGSDHVSHRDERSSFLSCFYHRFIKRLRKQTMAQQY